MKSQYFIRNQLQKCGHGNGKDVKCQTCDEMFSKPDQLGSHQTWIHENYQNIWMWLLWCFVWQRWTFENTQRRIHGNGKDMKCQTCNEMFSKPVQVGSHQTWIHEK